MTKKEAIYILRNTAFLAPSLEPIDEAIDMACEALKQADTPQTESREVCDRDGNCSECWKELHCRAKDTPQTERIKTHDYCDICNHKGCKDCIANNLDDYCVPSHYAPSDDTPQTDCDTCRHYKLACELFSEVCKYEPTTQTKTQNSNLTFEKRTMRDCYNCKRYETEGECVECHYEPKDEPQTETEIAKAIVHKMIDDSVIAEDAYPDLRQKMHDAVDEYEPQTDCAWR